MESMYFGPITITTDYLDSNTGNVWKKYEI